jgi:hypothetical protein
VHLLPFTSLHPIDQLEIWRFLPDYRHGRSLLRPNHHLHISSYPEAWTGEETDVHVGSLHVTYGCIASFGGVSLS